MTNQNIMKELLEFTDAGKHTKFRLLQSWQEYKYNKRVQYTLSILVQSLKAMANKQLKCYCKDIVVGNADVYKLLAYKTIIRILYFYQEELKIVDDMVYEYECYLSCFNWSDFLFGTPRPTDKLWDHRGE